MRLVVGVIGLAVLAAAAHVTIMSGGGYGSAHAVLTMAVAAGVGVGAMVIGSAWSQGRRGLAGALVVALVCGELFGLTQTAERLIAQRDLSQAPAREAEQARQALATLLQDLTAERKQLRSGRLEVAEAAQQSLAVTVLAKSAEKGCAANCRALLDEQTKTTNNEVAAARQAFEGEKTTLDGRIADVRQRLEQWRAPPSGTVLADRLGWAPWVLDLTMAALGSLGANGLAATLLAFAAHRRRDNAKSDDNQQRPAQPVAALASEEPRTDDSARDRVIAAPIATMISVDPVAANDTRNVSQPVVTDRDTSAVAVITEPSRETTAGNDDKSVIAMPKSKDIARRVGNVVEFMKLCCEFASSEDAVVEQSMLVDAYRAWCTSTKCSAHDDATLEKMFDMICEQTGIERKRHDDTIFWLGVLIAPARKKRARRV